VLLQEILQFSKDYKHMTKEKALDDFHHKIEHFKEQYEPIHPREESKYTYIKVFNDGESKHMYIKVFFYNDRNCAVIS
jgi:hypothetical protein